MIPSHDVLEIRDLRVDIRTRRALVHAVQL